MRSRTMGWPIGALLALSAILAGSGQPAAASEEWAPSAEAPSRPCTDQTGPAIEPIASAPLGIEGYHAAFHTRSGDPVLCAGSSGTAVVAFLNAGSLGWYAGKPGQTAFLGVAADATSILGSPEIGWAGKNRVAMQSTDYVGPGQVAWFKFKVKAPAAPGVYSLQLRPVIEGTAWLEDALSLRVTVKSSDDELPVALSERSYYPAISAGTKTIRVPSLMYHYVDPLPRDADRFRLDLTVSPRDFEDHLKYLKAQGYTTITTKQLWWTLDQGAPLPQRPVMLTFDDGYSNHYAYVLPLLRKYGFVGTFFVTANLVGREGYLTRPQVRALADAGMDVESHAVDHFSLPALSFERQQYQTCAARRILSEWTGADVRHFAYPSGDFNTLSFAALESCGYLSAYKKAGGSAQTSANMWLLQRSRVRGQQGLAALLVALRS